MGMKYKLVELVEKTNERYRLEILNKENQEKYEQFFTDRKTALYMASMVRQSKKKRIKILDPGAGIGILSIALLDTILTKWIHKPNRIELYAYEIDPNLIDILKQNYDRCKRKLKKLDIELVFNILNKNFMLDGQNNVKVDYIILNPPYKKIDSSSGLKKKLIEQNIMVPNEYAAFVLISKNILKVGGSLVALTPRSFCNGHYFEKFRIDLLKDSKFKDVHLYESRQSLFRDDQVLQENIVYHIVKYNMNSKDKVNIYYSYNENLKNNKKYQIEYSEFIHPDDATQVIRVLKNQRDKEITELMSKFHTTLDELGINVSTGPFVDFREKDELKTASFKDNSIPYLFPEHFDNENFNINWPKNPLKKFNYIVVVKENLSKARPMGTYVIVKRITSKEEQRRIVASIINEDSFSNRNFEFVAFDNKINYFHVNKERLSDNIAWGLCLYLNSTLVDYYFRLYSGHTQVNVSDLKNLKYPSISELEYIGENAREGISRETIDLLLLNL